MARSKTFYSGTGRRKTAIAGVWLYASKGDFLVNGKPIEDFFNHDENPDWVKPFHTVGISHPNAHFSATIKTLGGGVSGQKDAVTLGLSRALVAYNEEFRSKLRKAGLLTRDSREVERKKYYLRKARKAPQYSKR